MERSPAEIVSFIHDLIDGTGADWDWDDFEASGAIRDPVLEAYRQRAIRLGPPDADFEGLRQIVSELRARFPDVG